MINDPDLDTETTDFEPLDEEDRFVLTEAAEMLLAMLVEDAA